MLPVALESPKLLSGNDWHTHVHVLQTSDLLVLQETYMHYGVRANVHDSYPPVCFETAKKPR
jgi:hypothetical protein